MRRWITVIVLMAGFATAAFGQADASGGPGLDRAHVPAAGSSNGPGVTLTAARRTCKTVSSCREAVQMWCDGYSGADRDKDGIPCENVCHSKKQVDKIRAEIGC